jgi:hypothetical protein
MLKTPNDKKVTKILQIKLLESYGQFPADSHKKTVTVLQIYKYIPVDPVDCCCICTMALYTDNLTH